jgi:hypothetical protein
MHGSFGVVFESGYPFVFQEKEHKRNDQAVAAVNHSASESASHFSLLGFCVVARIEGSLRYR